MEVQAGEVDEVGVILIGILPSNQTLDKHFKTKVRRRYARIYCDRVCVCLLRFFIYSLWKAEVRERRNNSIPEMSSCGCVMAKSREWCLVYISKANCYGKWYSLLYSEQVLYSPLPLKEVNSTRLKIHDQKITLVKINSFWKGFWFLSVKEKKQT